MMEMKPRRKKMDAWASLKNDARNFKEMTHEHEALQDMTSGTLKGMWTADSKTND